MKSLNSIRQPVSVWNRNIKIDYKELFIALGKSAASASVGGWWESAKDVLDAIKSISVEKLTWQERAWLLINNAMTKSMFALVSESEGLCQPMREDTKDCNAEIADRIVTLLNNVKVEISRETFEHPENIQIIKHLQAYLEQILSKNGLTDIQSKNISKRLPNKFVVALHDEWRERHQEYKIIIEESKTPFDDSIRRLKEWEMYYARLSGLAYETMFGETFAVKDVYVDLRAYKYIEEQPKAAAVARHGTKGHAKSKQAFYLKEHLSGWLETSSKDDSFRVVTGGPGCGKSTFSKDFASAMAESNLAKILFIPLNGYVVGDDLVLSVGRYLSEQGIFAHNPLSAEYRSEKMCIIFDGLDELPISDDAARKFLEHATATIRTINTHSNLLKIIVTGRELIVNESRHMYRRDQEVLTILPYTVDNDDPFFTDSSKAIISIDQRGEWWSKYGVAVGEPIKDLPAELKGDGLDELTAQPLLNYLVAIARKRQFDFSAATNRNEIYEYLLSNVCKRCWEGGRQIDGVNCLDESEHIMLLEEIGITAWHGGEIRCTTLQAIELRCSEGKLETILTKFKKYSNANLMRLLASFFFRDAGDDSKGNQTFQFTHKTFGEYLVAKRLVREAETIHKDSEYKGELNRRRVLVDWCKLAGPGALDSDMRGFICNEIALCSIGGSDITAWQNHFSSLFSYLLKHGMPMESCGIVSFLDQLRQSRNAEESLLVMLNACACTTKGISKVDWPSKTSFGTWLYRIQEQRSGPIPKVALKCLSYMNFGNQVVDIHDFYGADFSNSTLVGLQTHYSNFGEAVFNNANLSNSRLSDVFLNGAGFDNTDFAGSYISVPVTEYSHSLLDSLRAAKFNSTVFMGIECNSSRELPTINALLKSVEEKFQRRMRRTLSKRRPK